MFLVTIDEEKCTGCGECTSACPNGVLELNDEGKASVTDQECLGCQSCIAVCPNEAVELQEL